MNRLLFIGAHPDDETFFAAGTFAKSTHAGKQIAVLCATRGQAGKTAGLCTADRLATVREGELRNALSVLGVEDLTLLPYQDRELANAPVADMREHLVRHLRRFRPDIVLTFDPHGGNLHPDHIAISRFVSDALPIAADPRWYPGLGEAHAIRRLLWTPPAFIYKQPPETDLRQQPGYDFLVDVSSFVPQKEAAFRAHATQFPGLRRLFFDNENGRRTFPLEAFRWAAGERPIKLPATDVFAT